MAFHDARTEQSVKRAVDDRLLNVPSPFSNPRLIDETLLFDFQRETA